MPALQVKDCPTAVYDRLRECAAQENRSISQQALTIIEGYLGLRDQTVAPIGSKGCPDPHQAPPGASGCYLGKRERVFDRIASLPPLPISKKSPNSAEMLHQAREEGAR